MQARTAGSLGAAKLTPLLEKGAAGETSNGNGSWDATREVHRVWDTMRRLLAGDGDNGSGAPSTTAEATTATAAVPTTAATSGTSNSSSVQAELGAGKGGKPAAYPVYSSIGAMDSPSQHLQGLAVRAGQAGVGEPDLLGWLHGALQSLQAFSARLSVLDAAPPVVKEAVLGLMSSLGASEMLGLVQRGGDGGVRGAHADQGMKVELEDRARLLAAERAAEQEGWELGKRGVQLPVLFPAGQLLFIHAAGGEGAGGGEPSQARYEVLQVPEGAPFFRSVSMGPRALREHKCRAYRAGLLKAIEGLRRH